MIDNKFLKQLDVSNEFLENLFNSPGLSEALIKKSDKNPLKSDISSFLKDFSKLSMIKQITQSFRKALESKTEVSETKDLMDDLQKRYKLTQTINQTGSIDEIAARKSNEESNEDYFKNNFQTPTTKQDFN